MKLKKSKKKKNADYTDCKKWVIKRCYKAFLLYLLLVLQISGARGHHTDTRGEDVCCGEMSPCSPALQAPGMAGEYVHFWYTLVSHLCQEGFVFGAVCLFVYI